MWLPSVCDGTPPHSTACDMWPPYPSLAFLSGLVNDSLLDSWCFLFVHWISILPLAIILYFSRMYSARCYIFFSLYYLFSYCKSSWINIFTHLITVQLCSSLIVFCFNHFRPCFFFDNSTYLCSILNQNSLECHVVSLISENKSRYFPEELRHVSVGLEQASYPVEFSTPSPVCHHLEKEAGGHRLFLPPPCEGKWLMINCYFCLNLII